MTISQAIAEVQARYSNEYPQATIEVYTFAIANQTSPSFHTDRCRCIYTDDIGYDAITPDTEVEVLDTQYADSETLNHTIYANTSESAVDDEEAILVFVRIADED